MSFLNITESQARADAQKYREQLTRALHSLANARHVSLGATPRDVVYTEDKMTLFRYKGLRAKGYGPGPAILICYALINRPSMMDLQADRSLIRSLLDN